MKVLLMHPDRDFDWQAELPQHAADLVADLGLEGLFLTMSAGDEHFRKVAQRALLWSLRDPRDIAFRQQTWTDCLEHPDAVRALYEITTETLVEKRKIFGWFSHWPEMNLSHAVAVMQLLMRMLRRLRGVAQENATSFRSPAFRRFFEMLQEELDDGYFDEVDRHLERLRFRQGVLVSAKLGQGNSGTEFVLRRPLRERPPWRERILGRRDRPLKFDVDPRDEAGHQAISELRSRGINLVADALGQSSDHVLSFFTQLRAELAFYLACLNLQAALTQKGWSTSLPDARPEAEGIWSALGLYDVGLALAGVQVVDNDLAGDGNRLVVVTGANRGGKSTFLRSLGLAQLMMQAGMFVPARSFRASVASDVFTHFKREEDKAMAGGKLDEELRRMSRIIDQVRPGALLLANESFASTNPREGAEIGEAVVRALNDEGVRVAVVTHLFELAQSLARAPGDGVLCLRAERLPDGRRTFKLREGAPLPTSYGSDLYREILVEAKPEIGG